MRANCNAKNSRCTGEFVIGRETAEKIAPRRSRAVGRLEWNGTRSNDLALIRTIDVNDSPGLVVPSQLSRYLLS